MTKDCKKGLLIPLLILCLLPLLAGISYGENDGFTLEPTNPFKNNFQNSIATSNKKILGNGMKVYTHENPGSGIVAAEIIIRVGAMEEMDNYAGVITMIQRMILKGGGKDEYIPLQEISEADGCYIVTDATPDFARISLTSTKEDFEKNFIRMTKVLKSPSFDSKKFNEEKKKLFEAVQGRNSAYGSIKEIFLAYFYQYHPYRRPIYGFKSTIKRMTPQMARDFYDKYYTGNRMSISIVGDIPSSKAVKLAEDNLSQLPSRKIKQVDIPWEAVGQDKKLYFATSSNRAWIFVGFPAPGIKSADYPKMKLLETLLGSGLSSRLFIELREKEGLAYSLSSKYPRLSGPAHMILFVVTSQKNLYKSRRKLFDEIKKLKKELITEEELQAARRKVMGEFLLEKESNRGRAFTMSYFSAMGLSPDYDETLLRRMEEVTPEDIREVARKYFVNYTVLVIESQPPRR